MVIASLLRRVMVAMLITMGLAPAVQAKDYEVWLVDQSNSPGVAFGGRISIFAGQDLTGKNPAAATPIDNIDLAGATAALCLAQTGANPVRPHMLFFNRAETHGVLAFVASGHVVVFDAASRTPLTCFRTSVGAGGARQAHAAVPAPDGTYILVANQNGKRLERIDTDYATNTFTLNAGALLDLAACTTPNGVPCEQAGVRGDNAPICPLIDAASQLGYVTLRGGGLLVVDPRATPMTIVGEYDLTTVHPNGCGGAQVGDTMYVTSGGGTAANLSEMDLYALPTTGFDPANPPNTPPPAVVFSDDDPLADRDGHGLLATTHGRHLWFLDRTNSLVEIFDTRDNSRVGTLDLKGAVSGDPAPDLAVISPTGNRIFFSLRGPNPLSGDPHAATGGTPGLGIVQVRQGGRSGVFLAVVPISNVDAGGVERADPHGIALRMR